MKSKLLITTLLALGLHLPSVHAAEQAGAAMEKPALGAVSLVTVNATVTAVDQETREVTLKNAEGEETRITVGEHVKNLPQVEVGDNVTIAYYESVDIRVVGAEEAEPRAAAIAALETAEPGQKPAGKMTTELSVVATIDGIDKAAETVTLKGPEGDTKTVKVRDPANLERVAIGDRVMIGLTRAIAVEVTETTSAE